MARKAKAPRSRPATQRSVEAALTHLSAIEERVKTAHETIADDLQAALDKLAGASFPSHDDAVAATRLVQELMQRLAKRAKCPNTGKPSNLRCSKTGRYKKTSFQFEHFVGGKRTVSAASATFPTVHLIEAPADRRKRT